MTTKELLALPRAKQDDAHKEWMSLIIVPTKSIFEDSSWRVFALIGCEEVKGQCTPTHVITEGDLISWIRTNVAPQIDMDAETNCVMLSSPGKVFNVFGSGGTIYAHIVRKGGEK